MGRGRIGKTLARSLYHRFGLGAKIGSRPEHSPVPYPKHTLACKSRARTSTIVTSKEDGACRISLTSRVWYVLLSTRTLFRFLEARSWAYDSAQGWLGLMQRDVPPLCSTQRPLLAQGEVRRKPCVSAKRQKRGQEHPIMLCCWNGR